LLNQRLLRETVTQNRGDAQPGEHLDSPPPSLVASFRNRKVAHYTGKIKRKSKVVHTCSDVFAVAQNCVMDRYRATEAF